MKSFWRLKKYWYFFRLLSQTISFRIKIFIRKLINR